LLLTLIAMPIATTIGLPTLMIKILLAACLFAAIMPNATKRTRTLLLAATGLLVLARFASEYGYLRSIPVLSCCWWARPVLLAAAGHACASR
jgi:hypothetical protein